MPKPASSPKRRTPVRTRRVPPSIPAELLADVAKLFAEHVRDQEKRRLDVFERAWASIAEGKLTDSMRVALAVAYLGGKSSP
jgi:hypothetical protein